MTDNVIIRSAREGDLEAVRALLRSSDLTLDGLEEQFGEGYAVAVSGDSVVGVEGIEVYGGDGLLRSAAIAPSWRGQGLGDALTRDRIAWSRRRGLGALYLLTTTAGAYFPRFGFKTVSRETAPAGIRASREFSAACCASGSFMYLPLGTEN